MRWVLFLVMLAAVGFAPAPVFRPNKHGTDLDELQGTWVQRPRKDGTTDPMTSETWTFNGAEVRISTRDGLISETCTWAVVADASSGPKVLRMKSRERAQSAFYDLTNDRLMLNLTPPKEPQSDSALVCDGGGRLRVFYRQTKP
jgi:hypothetical protein